MKQLKEKIFKEKKIKAIKRFGKVKTKVFINKSTGSRSMISGITIIPKNESINLHYHNCEEAVTILQGNAIAEIDNKKYKLKEGDVSWIPPKIAHRFFNKNKKDLKIYWTYANINATRTDVLTGKTNKITDEHKKKIK